MGTSYSTANLAIWNSTFQDNKARADGGAVFVGDRSYGRLTFCRFLQNNATRNGGAFIVNGQGALEVSASLIVDNHAGAAGGALRVEGDSSATINSSCLLGNTAPLGGAVSIEAGVIKQMKALLFSASVFGPQRYKLNIC